MKEEFDLVAQYGAAKFITSPEKRKLAFRQAGEAGCVNVLWLGGYQSDMLGSKAHYLHDLAVSSDAFRFTRFDYAGHGESPNRAADPDGFDFEQGTIKSWTKDAAAVLKQFCDGPTILVGSSMGAWIASLLANTIPEKIAGAILIAPAPDFVTELHLPNWSEEMIAQCKKEGKLVIPTEDPDWSMVFTWNMIQSGKEHRVLNKPLRFPGPVHILQGMQDEPVPWAHMMRFAEHLDNENVQISIHKESDHRFSSDKDLQLLGDSVLAMVKQLKKAI